MAFQPPPLESLEEGASSSFTPPPVSSLETNSRAFVPPPVSSIESAPAEVTSGTITIEPTVPIGVGANKSDRWNAMQAESTRLAKEAGLPQLQIAPEESESRMRLQDAISRAESAGYEVPHFIGKSNEPEGDRGPTMDVENLVKALALQEQDVIKSGDRAKANSIAKERSFWENDLAVNGMTADQWKKQTGEDEPKREVGFLESLWRSSKDALLSVPQAVNSGLEVFPYLESKAIEAVTGKDPELFKKWHDYMVGDLQNKREKLEPQQEEDWNGIGAQLGQALGPLARDIPLTLGAAPAEATGVINSSANLAKNVFGHITRGFQMMTPTATIAGIDAERKAKKEGKDDAHAAAIGMGTSLLVASSGIVPLAAESAASSMPLRVLERAIKGGVSSLPVSAGMQQGQNLMEGRGAMYDLKSVGVGALPMAAMAAFGGKSTYKDIQSEIKAKADVISKELSETIKPVEETSVASDNSTTVEAVPKKKVSVDEAKYGPDKSLRPSEEEIPDITNDWVTSTSQEGSSKESKIGIVPKGTPELIASSSHVAAIAKWAKDAIYGVPKFTAFKEALLKWVARNQKSTSDIRRVMHDIKKHVPSQQVREGITNWIQAGGDKSVLKYRADNSTNLKLKQGYEAALKLSPDQQVIAQKIKDTYGILLQRAKKYGIELNELENYVNQIWDRGGISSFATSSSQKLSGYFKFSKPRVFESFFEGEQAGFKPKTKDIGKLLPIYINELNNAINSRRFVEELAKGVASDGRPYVAPKGGLKTVDAEKGKIHLVFPDSMKEDFKDYRVLDQPALHDWNWKGKDEQGNSIFLKSDLALHPEIHGHLKKVLGERSVASTTMGGAIVGKTFAAARTAQSYAKQTMLSLSPFHMVQEGVHAIGHRINPLSVPKIDLRIPEQMDAAEHGLMLSHDKLSAGQFMEGLTGGERNLITLAVRKFGGKAGEKLASVVDSYQRWLFEDYIPGLKYKTYESIVERNSHVFKKELASGEVSLSQVKNISSQQANAAYGHLNYAELGRSRMAQNLLQTFLLAPDFLEARGRFAGQALKGLVGSKTGREQLLALGFLALTQWIGARIGNKLINDDYEFEHPFELHVGNKLYGFRSVPEDMYKLWNDPRAFTYGRISPIFGKGVIEGISGVNYRGEKTEFGETVKGMLANTIPLPIQSVTRGLTGTTRSNPISPMEQVMSSAGIVVHRYSPITENYKLARKWMEINTPDKVTKTVYPVSKYAQLRYALEDSDFDKAKEEIKKLQESGIPRSKIAEGFKASINHPFTGSQASDKKFFSSLDEDEKKSYKAAVSRRQDILHRFMRVK